MEQWIPFLVIVGGAVLVLFVLKQAEKAGKKRVEEWEKVGKGLGLTYEKTDEQLPTRFPGFNLFEWGNERRAENCLRGTRDGIELLVADYFYVTGRGSKRSTTVQTICLLTAPELSLPAVFLRKEFKLLDAIGKMAGGQDINFPDDKEFSDSFVLQGKDEAAVRRLFTPAVRRVFLKLKGGNLNFEANGPTLLFHQHERIEPQDLRKMTQTALALLAAFRESLKPA